MIGCLPRQALAFLAVFVYATHATQAIAFEWKPGISRLKALAVMGLAIRPTWVVCYWFNRRRLKAWQKQMSSLAINLAVYAKISFIFFSSYFLESQTQTKLIPKPHFSGKYPLFNSGIQFIWWKQCCPKSIDFVGSNDVRTRIWRVVIIVIDIEISKIFWTKYFWQA